MELPSGSPLGMSRPGKGFWAPRWHHGTLRLGTLRRFYSRVSSLARGGLPLICMEAREKHTRAPTGCVDSFVGDPIMWCSSDIAVMIGLDSAL
jgi:hypothetical protein